MNLVPLTKSEYKPKTGETVVLLDSVGKPYLQTLRYVNGPFISKGGNERIEFTTEEYNFKQNRLASEVHILKM